MKHNDYVEQIQHMNEMTYTVRLKYYDSIKVMPYSEYAILQRLVKMRDKATSMNMTQLAHDLKLTTPAVSRTVKTLVVKGWVVRKVDPEDRRTIFLKVTEEGAKQFNHMKQKQMDFMAQVYGNIPDEDLRQYIKVGNQILQGMQAIYQETLDQSNDLIKGEFE